jgi:predicted nucleic acid-binding protein
VDTSAFYAFLVARDRYHCPLRDFLGRAVERGDALFSSSFALCETLGLLQARHGLRAARVFMERVYPIVEWWWIDERLFSRIWRLANEHGRRGLTAVDASAVACIEDRPGKRVRSRRR